MTTKQVYQKEIEAKLDLLDAQIAEMRAKADLASAELKVQYQEQLRMLTERRKTAGQKLNELQQSSEAAWENMKVGVESAFGELKTAFDKAMAQFQ